ncbi:signal peptidase complex subunit 2-like [Symsagittifera roscoffensis]|uniref:signal peptidase complex subunit 2-like n=1 Tax=Symsagittifera roscoffensis TaxID=84072 RepID=UPI00307BD99A
MGSMLGKKGSESTDKENGGDEKIQVNKWDSSAVKNAIDDCAKQVASGKFNFEEVFQLMNIRLVISCVAVSFAALALLYDLANPFPKSKYVLATCSLSYFFMMGIFTLFTLLKEKNIVYQGDDRETVVGIPCRLEMGSTLKKYQNIFHFDLALHNGDAHEEIEFSFPVENYFTEDGVLLEEKFEKLLTENFNKIVHVRKGESKKKN